jgi:plastocyanin
MRRTLLTLTIAASAFLVAACASESDPGWTYAPPTPAPAVTPAPSGGTGEPTPVPGGSEAPAPTDGGNASGAVKITASGVAYTEAEVAAPADVPFVIEFDNQDAGIPHDVVIRDASGAQLFKGDLVTGPMVVQYQVDTPLPAGDYTFVCSVHPGMVGTLKVGA